MGTPGSLSSQSEKVKKDWKRLQRLAKKAKKRISWRKTWEASRKSGVGVEKQMSRMENYYKDVSEDRAPRDMVQGLIDFCEKWYGAFPRLLEVSEFCKEHFRNLLIHAVDSASEYCYRVVAYTIPEDDGVNIALDILRNNLWDEVHVQRRRTRNRGKWTAAS